MCSGLRVLASDYIVATATPPLCLGVAVTNSHVI